MIEPQNISFDGEDGGGKIRAKANMKISQELRIDDIQFDERIDWDPPSEHGLKHSDVIIPQYYHLHKTPKSALNLDYYEIVKDDIRNFRALNKYQLEYIKSLSHTDKNELFGIFNSCIESICNIIDR
jgi:hypothetical protein